MIVSVLLFLFFLIMVGFWIYLRKKVFLKIANKHFYVNNVTVKKEIVEVVDKIILVNNFIFILFIDCC